MRPFLTTCLTSIFLLNGCAEPETVPAPIEEPLFCDVVTERFRYTQPEITWRAANAPANLRRSFEINLTFDAECVKPGGGDQP